MLQPARGSTPKGTGGEQQASKWVQQMFAGIAPKYDLLNHVLSFNIDRSWRKGLIASFDLLRNRPDARILDLCCGTGDVLLDLRARTNADVMGADFCHPMLVAAQEKARGQGRGATLFEADALQLPVADNSFDGISIAFGFRNLANYRDGLIELARILKPGGVLAILEFSHPPGVFVRTAYGFYSRTILPLVGGLLSGSRQAYTYLPASIRNFPAAEELSAMMSAAGFTNCEYQLFSGGIAALHTGTKPGLP
jgi:demethylmenaquinone methyltransferase / 2-methoxy-6-polyprenyl-1,4-benzoquinol methylase